MPLKMGLPGLLLVLFIGLKLTGYITWSWIWVLAPVWIGLAIFFGFMVIALLFGIIVAMIDK